MGGIIVSKDKIKSRWIKIFFLLFVLLCIIGSRLFIGEFCVVSSESMEPTIRKTEVVFFEKRTFGAKMPQGLTDIPILNFFTWMKKGRDHNRLYDPEDKRIGGIRQPEVNDVVVFLSPENGTDLLVKRINKIFEKEEPVRTDMVGNEKMQQLVEKEGGHIVYRHNKCYINGKHIDYYLPKQNFYYVLGDNRKNSHDSRSFGYIPESSIVGRMGLILFSWDSEGFGIFKIRWHRLFHLIR